MKKKKVVLTAAAIIVVAVIAVAVIMLNAAKDPKTKVIRAFARLFSEDVGSRIYGKKDGGNGLLYSKYFQTNKKYRKNAENAMTGRFAYGGSCKLDSLDADIPGLKDVISYISGIRLSGEGAVDLKEERIHLSAGASYAIVSLPWITLDITGSEVALSASGFFDGSLTVDTEGMGTAFNASELSDIFRIKLSDERVEALDKGLFSDDTASKDNDKIIKAVIELYDSVQVDEPLEKRDIFIDGKVVSCDVYQICVGAADIGEFLSATGFDDIDVKNDCIMEAALTPKGNLAYFGGDYADYSFDLEIRSEECARNDMNMMFAKSGEGSVELAVNGSENGNIRQDEITIDVNRNGQTYSCELSCESEMTPSGVEIDIKEINLKAFDMAVALSGSLDVFFDAEEIEAVPEPKREILRMSEADFDKLGVEIYDHLMDNDLIAMVLNQFDSEPVVSGLIDLMNSGR